MEAVHQFAAEGVAKLGLLRTPSVLDPALDMEAMRATTRAGSTHLLEFVHTRDPSHLRWRPGHEVETTWYTLRPIPVAAMRRYVMEGGTVIGIHTRALQVALVRVEHWVDPDTGELRGERWEPAEFVEGPEGVGRLLRVRDLERVIRTPEVYEELGSIAFARGRLDPKARARLQLPDGCVSALFESSPPAEARVADDAATSGSGG